MPKITQSWWSLDIQRDIIDVTSERPSPNEHWRFTDSRGHEHYYKHGYPTLDDVVDESHWCNGDEGWAHHDPHRHIDASHYECRICREVIEPKYDPPYTRKHIAGMIDATLTATIGPDTIVARLSDDEWQRISTADDQNATVASIVEALPDERIIQREWRG